jgi:hypothetical protein
MRNDDRGKRTAPAPVHRPHLLIWCSLHSVAHRDFESAYGAHLIARTALTMFASRLYAKTSYLPRA